MTREQQIQMNLANAPLGIGEPWGDPPGFAAALLGMSIRLAFLIVALIY